MQAYKMNPTKTPYTNIKSKMKFGNQELPVLTNNFFYPGRENVNDKFNCLIDNIWNIPKYTDGNEQLICSIKKGIICALYNFCMADNQVPILTKASPSGKGYAFFVLLTGPHKGVFTSVIDLCIAKEGIQNPRYKGFYSREEADKALELDTTDMTKIKQALELEPETAVINADQTKNTTKTYKDFVSPTHQSPENHLNLENFKKIQKLLFKVHTNQTSIHGLYIGVHAYFDHEFVCLKEIPLCKDNTNCLCKIKFLFRKARLDLDQFKPVNFEDLAISIKSLLDYGCLESILIPPSKRFEGFDPSINDAINLIQAKMMSCLAIKIVTCPSNFAPQNYPTHVIKLLMEDHKEYPCVLFNDGYETWDIQGNIHYQYSLLRAQVQGYRWFFSKTDEREFNLIKETFDTKLFMPSYNGKLFIPFPIDLNNKLAQFFQKNKEIYEASSCYGQQTPLFPSTDLSMFDSSEILGTSSKANQEDVYLALDRQRDLSCTNRSPSRYSIKDFEDLSNHLKSLIKTQNLLYSKVQILENNITEILELLKSKDQQTHFSSNDLDTTQLSKLPLGKNATQSSKTFVLVKPRK